MGFSREDTWDLRCNSQGIDRSWASEGRKEEEEEDENLSFHPVRPGIILGRVVRRVAFEQAKFERREKIQKEREEAEETALKTRLQTQIREWRNRRFRGPFPIFEP